MNERMRKSGFTEAQIIGMIKEQEAGFPTVEVCGKHGGMEVSDAHWLGQLEDENGKRKWLAGDSIIGQRDSEGPAGKS
jgi:putative transposase